jgi:hypothetical protein
MLLTFLAPVSLRTLSNPVESRTWLPSWWTSKVSAKEFFVEQLLQTFIHLLPYVSRRDILCARRETVN